MSILMELFGRKIKIRIEATFESGDEFSGVAEVAVLGVTQEEIKQKLKDALHVEFGERVKELKIIAST